LRGHGKAFAKAIDDQKLHKLNLNDRQKKAIEYLKAKGEISRKEYAEISRVSLRQANKDLNYLLQKKVIIQIGMGRSTKYRVHDYVIGYIICHLASDKGGHWELIA